MKMRKVLLSKRNFRIIGKTLYFCGRTHELQKIRYSELLMLLESNSKYGLCSTYEGFKK